jgi:tetratricopeptide (TPR) repeat protein
VSPRANDTVRAPAGAVPAARPARSLARACSGPAERVAGTRGAAAAVLALALLAGAARATEDAGTVSPLSFGAGNRALALGGAYAAVADDAAGWMWNPAGLGRVPRSRLEVTHTQLAPLDLTEQYLGYVMPSWRWGALAATWRQLGVTGIEARDARNARLDAGLDAKESEVAIAYGLAPSEAWSLGLAAKLRRQELAGRAAGAFGADVGVQVSPARLLSARASAWDGLRVGLAVRNAVQPSMRLDLDEVPDPRAMRMGLAWERALGGFQTVLVALDLERTEDAGARAHTGLEWRPHPSMDARAGFDGDRMTAGVAFRLRGLTVDYAFADHALDPQHRLGLGFGFGATVSESRLAAARARDAALEREVAATLESRQDEQARALRAEVDAAARDGDLARARETLGILRALRSDDAALAGLEAGLARRQAAEAEAAGDLISAATFYRQLLGLAPDDVEARAGLERVGARASRVSARADSLAGALRQALDAFAAGSLAESRRTLDRLVRERPADTLARNLLGRVDRGIAVRAGTMVERAMRAAAGGGVADAERALAELRGLSPDHAAIPGVMAAIERARRGAGGPTASAASDGPTPAEREEARRHFERAMTLLRSGQRDDAIRWLEVVRSLDPAHAAAGRVLVQEYQVQGLEAFAAGRLETAVDLWQRALAVDPANPRTQAYLTRAREHLARTSVVGTR